MEVHYYLSVNPLEALIASQLDPVQFGQYMSTGKKNGSYERIMFAEVEGDFGNDFDWAYAKERTVPHEDGAPKHSVWLSVYRSLEHLDFSSLKALYLTTKDGRSLEIKPQEFDTSLTPGDYFIYQELCPITPLVVSRLNPMEFSEYMTDTSNKVHVPKLVFADLKTVDPDDYENTGNIGGAYDRNLDHLRDCIRDVTTQKDKPNKNVERSVEGFSYAMINHGIYFGEGTHVVYFPMPSQEDLRSTHYDWARSANIL